MKKILYISKNRDYLEKIQETYLELHKICEFTHGETFMQEDVMNANKILIEEDQILDVNIMHALIRDKGAENIVLILKSQESNLAKHFVLSGIHMHYMSSPLYSLLHKIEGITTIENAQENARENLKKSGTKLVALTSPMGGSGKTTLALNLADVLSQKKKKVLLVDLSIYSDVAAKLQIPYKNSFNNLISTIIKDIEVGLQENKMNSFKNNVYHYEKRNTNFDILFGLTPIQAEKITSEVIEEIVQIITAFSYDVVLFDTASGVSEMNLSLVECVDTVLSVSLADVGSGWKTILQKELFEIVQVTKKCRLVINRFSKKSGFSCKQLEKELQYPLLGVIPENAQVGFYANSGKLISQSNQKGFQNYINQIAHEILPVFTRTEIKTRTLR